MNSELFSAAIGELDDKYIDEAVGYKKKANKHALMKWGAVAACMCLAAAGVVFLSTRNGIFTSESSVPDDIIGGGLFGGDSFMSYIAVYPATESFDNVATADSKSLTESEAMDQPLAEHLPKQLPEGYHYGRGSIRNTVMKNGTQYSMLRVEYITGYIPEQQYTEDGGAVAYDTSAIGDYFTVCVLSFNPLEPDSDDIIFSSGKEVTLSYLEENTSVYIRAGECYVSVCLETSEPKPVLEAMRYIE